MFKNQNSSCLLVYQLSKNQLRQIKGGTCCENGQDPPPENKVKNESGS